MNLLLLFLIILQTSLATASFGNAYMRKTSKVCHQWSCINTKLGFPDTLPPKDQFTTTLGALLPAEWQDLLEPVVDACYNNRTRRYTNTCSGQAVLHCAMDLLNNNCPIEHTRVYDGCAPINSLAGFPNMFTQSRYKDLETNILLEKRPAWFLRNYFSKKCCNLPELFNSTVLSECGFNSTIAYYNHDPKLDLDKIGNWHEGPVDVANMQFPPDESKMTVSGLPVQTVKLLHKNNATLPDPLDCCDLSLFIPPEWREQCHFKLDWDWMQRKRLVVNNTESIVTTEAPAASDRVVLRRDVMLMPQSCEKETCVFKKLNAITESNTTNTFYLTKMLQELTLTQPEWENAVGRTITTCLTKPLLYEGECMINQVLSCIFDVMTENCPNQAREDPCKHVKPDGDRVCQISSSKLRPKHRRSVCQLPELVNLTILNECGLRSMSREQYVNVYNTTTKPRVIAYSCQDLTPSTSCVLTKLGVLNQYGFMDYLKMKDKLRSLPNIVDGYRVEEAIMAAFSNSPLYNEHCNSPRKLLNVLDSMLMTCPPSKRKQTEQCSLLFEAMKSTEVYNEDQAKQLIERVVKNYQSFFIPRKQNKIRNYATKIVKHTQSPYGILNSENAPKVKLIDLSPKVEKKTLVLTPVYMRVPVNNLSLVPRNDNTLRSGVLLRNSVNIQQPTIPTISTNQPISTKSFSTITPPTATPAYYRVPNSNLLIRSNNIDVGKPLFYKTNAHLEKIEYSSVPTTSNTVPTTTELNKDFVTPKTEKISYSLSEKPDAGGYLTPI